MSHPLSETHVIIHESKLILDVEEFDDKKFSNDLLNNCPEQFRDKFTNYTDDLTTEEQIVFVEAFKKTISEYDLKISETKRIVNKNTVKEIFPIEPGESVNEMIKIIGFDNIPIEQSQWASFDLFKSFKSIIVVEIKEGEFQKVYSTKNIDECISSL